MRIFSGETESIVYFIDLAGDERTGIGLEESCQINKEKSILRTTVRNNSPMTTGDFCKFLRYPLRYVPNYNDYFHSEFG